MKIEKTDMSTFSENPCTKSTTTKGRFWHLFVFLANGRHYVTINTETNDFSNPTWSRGYNNNILLVIIIFNNNSTAYSRLVSNCPRF